MKDEVAINQYGHLYYHGLDTDLYKAIQYDRAGKLIEFIREEFPDNLRACGWGSQKKHALLDELGRQGYLKRPTRKDLKNILDLVLQDYGLENTNNYEARIELVLHIPEALRSHKERVEYLEQSDLLSKGSGVDDYLRENGLISLGLDTRHNSYVSAFENDDYMTVTRVKRHFLPGHQVEIIHKSAFLYGDDLEPMIAQLPFWKDRSKQGHFYYE